MLVLSVKKFNEKLAKLLLTKELTPLIKEDILSNGLQVRAKATVSKVGFGVSASVELFKMAVKAKCDALVVHHGLSGGTPWLDQITQDRFTWLIKNKISLWGYHAVLDDHPVLGHNERILTMLGAVKTEPYLRQGESWGRWGQLPQKIELKKIISQLQPLISPNFTLYNFGPAQIQSVVCVSGKGAPYTAGAAELMQRGVDLFITGEVHEWNREDFRETKINFLAAGHYYTETFGLRVLQEIAQTKWSLKTIWLDLPNNV